MMNLAWCCICLLLLVLSFSGGTPTGEISDTHNDRTNLPELDDSGQIRDATASAFSCNLLAEQMNKCVSVSSDHSANSNNIVTEVEHKLADEFIKDYAINYETHKQNADRFYQKLVATVHTLKFWVPPSADFRLKDPDSLKVKLFDRLQKPGSKDFTSYEEILTLMYDIIGVRFTCYMPSIDIERIIQLLNMTKGIEIVEVKHRPSGLYRGTNVHAKVGGQHLEIQLRGAFYHGFYQIYHKYGYKPKVNLSDTAYGHLMQLQDHVFKAEKALEAFLESSSADGAPLKSYALPYLKLGDEHEAEWGSLLSHYKRMDGLKV